MADNPLVGSGAAVPSDLAIASDDIAGVQHQLIKLEFGALNSATLVSPTNPLPVTLPLSSAPAETNVAASATSVTLSALSLTRLGWIIWNDSTSILYVKFGTAALVTSCSYKVQPDGTLDSNGMGFIYTGVITGIWVAATGNARVTEFFP